MKNNTENTNVYAPMAEDVPTIPPRFRTDVDDLSTGTIWAMLAGCFVAMVLAVWVMG